MKNWICISAIFLLNASTDAFAPHPLTFANTVRRRAAHTAHAPHQNSYLEQLAATPMKEQETQKPSTPEPEPNISMEAAATAAPPTTQQQEEEEEDSTKSLLQKVKEAGVAGAISYALWELGAQILPIVLRMQLFQNSNEILSSLRQYIKDFGGLVSQFVWLDFRN
jgi:hypothetical protein